MGKILSNAKIFYSSLLLVSFVIFFVLKVISAQETSYISIISLVAFVLSILLIEKIISGIYKTPYVEIRAVLFLFLFLSPLIHLNLYLLHYKYLSIFFVVFGLFNYFLYEKHFQKIFICISISAIILSIYFYSYSIIIALPLVIYILSKLAWKGIIYFFLLIIPTLSMLIFNLISLELISQWNINNWFRSDFGLISYNTINIIFAFFPLFHPLIFVAGILALPFVRFSDFGKPMIKISALSYILFSLFVAGLPFQHFSMLIVIFPFLFLILFPAILRVIHLSEYFRPTFIKILPYIIILVQLSLSLFLVKNNEQMFIN